MTTDQIHEAMGQMLVHCRNLMESRDYHMVSARGTLHTLGYTTEQAEEVLTALHEGGFNYCLDPMFPWTDPDTGKVERLGADVCHWGPDQLESRVEWVVPFKYR
jgi:hypothetical protein